MNVAQWTFKFEQITFLVPPPPFPILSEILKTCPTYMSSHYLHNQPYMRP